MRVHTCPLLIWKSSFGRCSFLNHMARILPTQLPPHLEKSQKKSMFHIIFSPPAFHSVLHSTKWRLRLKCLIAISPEISRKLGISSLTDLSRSLHPQTTLLNVLAGRAGTGVITGDRFVNGQDLPHDFQAQTYVIYFLVKV